MEYYIEMQVHDDPDLSTNWIMGLVFSKLHLALATFNCEQIGVSFPDVDKTLGRRMRLHASEVMLSHFMATKWMSGLDDYMITSKIQLIPFGCKHRVVSRVQVKSNVDRLYRRSVKKGWCTEEEASKRAGSVAPTKENLPYLHLKSGSTGQSFRLFIKHGSLCDDPVGGTFSSYGLSAIATVPWF